jgi:hypothetical protein
MRGLLCAVLAGALLRAGGCPAGYRCDEGGIAEPCPAGAYSLEGWGACCTGACAGAMNRSCACAPMQCAEGLEPQRGPPGVFVCAARPSQCSGACAAGMLREGHTCNCLRPQGVWGDAGGPYFEA